MVTTNPHELTRDDPTVSGPSSPSELRDFEQEIRLTIADDIASIRQRESDEAAQHVAPNPAPQTIEVVEPVTPIPTPNSIPVEKTQGVIATIWDDIVGPALDVFNPFSDDPVAEVGRETLPMAGGILSVGGIAGKGVSILGKALVGGAGSILGASAGRNILRHLGGGTMTGGARLTTALAAGMNTFRNATRRIQSAGPVTGLAAFMAGVLGGSVLSWISSRFFGDSDTDSATLAAAIANAIAVGVDEGWILIGEPGRGESREDLLARLNYFHCDMDDGRMWLTDNYISRNSVRAASNRAFRRGQRHGGYARAVSRRNRG